VFQKINVARDPYECDIAFDLVKSREREVNYFDEWVGVVPFDRS